MALSYCLLWSSRYIQTYIKRVAGAITEGDESAADELPQLHATLSGLKATATVRAHECIEECRKCCGSCSCSSKARIASLLRYEGVDLAGRPQPPGRPIDPARAAVHRPIATTRPRPQPQPRARRRQSPR